jgi:hypothetical protein
MVASERYRGFKRNGGCVLGHSIITVPNLLYGLKDALAHLGPYQTLKKVWYNDRGVENTVFFLPATIQI